MKALLFDLDDTLYPEREFVESGFRAVARYLEETESLDREDLFRRMMRILDREGRGHVFDTVLKEFDRYRPELVPVLVHVYRTHSPTITLFEDVEPGLRRLRAVGVRLGVVTDGLATVQRRKIAALNLEPLVDVVVCTDEVGRDHWKPSVVPFQVAMELLRVEAAESAYVGNDPSKDFAGPRDLGMKTILMRRPGTEQENAEADERIADLTIRTVDELVVTVAG